MTAIASLDALISNLTGGGAVAPDHEWFFMNDRVQNAASSTVMAFAAGRYTSLWRLNKTNGANGAAAPSFAAAAAPTLATVGALPFTNPTGGRQKFLLGMENGIATAGVLVVYDRLMHCSGVPLSTAQANTVTGGAAARYTGAAADGNQLWLEYGGTSAQIVAGCALTVTYTNQAGVAGRVTPTIIPGTTTLQALVPVPLQDGDTGVQSVETVTVSVTGTAGATVGVVIARPLLSCISAGVAGGSVRDAISGLPAMPEVKTDACLAFMFFSNTTTVPTGFVGLHLAEN